MNNPEQGYTWDGNLPELLDVSLMSAQIANPLGWDEDQFKSTNDWIEFTAEADIQNEVFICSFHVRIMFEAENAAAEVPQAQFAFALIYGAENIDQCVEGENNSLRSSVYNLLAMSSLHTIRGILPSYLHHTFMQNYLLPSVTADQLRTQQDHF